MESYTAYPSATAAHALLGHAGDHPLDPRQFRRQRLAATGCWRTFFSAGRSGTGSRALSACTSGRCSLPVPTPVTPTARWSVSRCPDHISGCASAAGALPVPGSLVLHIAAPGTFCSRWLGQCALQLFEKFVEGRLGGVRTHDNLLSNTTITIMESHSCRSL